MLRKLLSAAMACCLLFATACSSPARSSAPAENQAGSDQGYLFTDFAGRTVSVPRPPGTVVSLFSSYGAIWLEAGGNLAGVTEDFHTNYPSSLAQDAANLGSFSQPNTDALLGLAPDFVILSQDIPAHADVAHILDQAQISYAFFRQESYQDYLETLGIFTDILDNQSIYQQSKNQMETQIDRILQDNFPMDSSKILLVRSSSSKVQLLGQKHHMGAMLTQLGAVNIADLHPSLLQEMSVETILDENPSLILIVPMGDSAAANAAFETMVQSSPLWQQVDAVQQGKVYLLPKELFQLKPNARWAESYETLAKIIADA